MKLLDKHENIFVDTRKQDGEILIHIPVDTLFYAMNHRQYYPLIIHDKQKMIDYVVEWLIEWGGDAEVGSTAFEDFLDRMFSDAYESGEDWLDEDDLIFPYDFKWCPYCGKRVEPIYEK
jgi:hypothetical protein